MGPHLSVLLLTALGVFFLLGVALFFSEEWIHKIGGGAGDALLTGLAFAGLASFYGAVAITAYEVLRRVKSGGAKPLRIPLHVVVGICAVTALQLAIDVPGVVTGLAAIRHHASYDSALFPFLTYAVIGVGMIYYGFAVVCAYAAKLGLTMLGVKSRLKRRWVIGLAATVAFAAPWVWLSLP